MSIVLGSDQGGPAMPIRTAEQYLDSLRDDREVYIGGDRVKDVTKDARFAGAAETMADLLQMQHEPVFDA